MNGNSCTVKEQEKPTTCIIIGASGALGSETARLLAAKHNLLLIGRSLSKLEALQKELQKEHQELYEICSLDFSNTLSRSNFKNWLLHEKRPISALVILTPKPHFHQKNLLQDDTTWLEVFQNTFIGPAAIIKETLPYLSNPSKIAVIAGTTAVQYQPTYGPSCVIRRAWTTYVKALSHELGPKGVSINALSPGIILTDFHRERIEKSAKENGRSYEKQMELEVAPIPLQRHGKPEEVAKVVQFMLSKESDFINGANILLDGGLTVSYQ